MICLTIYLYFLLTGGKSQSNLNEIDKSEQKSGERDGKEPLQTWSSSAGGIFKFFFLI